MRFKAVFSDRGLHVLEKGFLPTFEKFGKTCQLLLGPDEVHFVQTNVNTDGSYVTARFAVEVLFDSNSYKLQSKHFNLVGFSVDVGLFLRVLRGAGATSAESLEVKMTLRDVPVAGGLEQQSKPFLSFQGKGQSLSMVQDLPISKPFPPDEIDRLVQIKDVGLCPYYVDLQPCTTSLQAMVDRMKSLGDTLMFATCKNGDVHLQVNAINALLGTQVLELSVYPQDVVASSLANRSLPAEQQLQQATEAGGSTAVYLQVKHFSRALAVQNLTMPSQILCGIAESATHVHIMYVFRDPMSDTAYDETINLSFKLPVKDEP